MSLAFFYPLAWLGALTVAVPIWLHLRRRQEANLVRFSAMQFLDEQPLARRRPMWPHNWPLLLLRLAGLLALVAAFSWPYLPTQQSVVIKESCVYILDNTLSHQADGGFQKARDTIAAALAGVGLEKQIAVVELTALPRAVVGFGDDRTTAIERVRALKPSFQRGSYLAAFRAANDLLGRSLGRRRHIVLLGDSQENQWTEAGHVLPFLKDVEITLPEVTAASRSNVALTNPNVRRKFINDRAVAECAVRLYHLGGPKTASLVFQANGKEVARREVPLGGQPESINVSAQWETDPGQWLFGEVRLEGKPDALPADDRAFFTLAPVREGRVALLAKSPFLQVALSPEIMKGRWKTRVLSASDLRGDGQTQPEEDVLCVESHYLDTAPARRLVLNYLDGGRGVFVLLDQTTPLVSAFLRDLGMESLSEAPRTPEAHFRYVFMEHPIFQPFRAPDFGNLMEIQVQRHRRIAAPSATPLAYSSDGDPLFLEFPRPRGKLFVLAFALDRTETNWPIHPTFIPFLDRCLDQARPQQNIQTAYEPGETALWQLPAGRQATEVVLRSDPGYPLAGGGGTEVWRSAVTDGQACLSIPDAPGLYAISYDGSREVESLLAVNPSPEESRLTYTASPDVVCSWKSRDGEGESSPDAVDSAMQLTKEEILRQQVWWWLAVAGLGALTIETTWISLRKVRA